MFGWYIGTHRFGRNPLEFQPEGFLNESSNLDYSGNNFNYIPFGSGRRICAGLPLAEKTLMYILALLLHSFEWKLPHGTELEFSDNFGFVTKKLNPTVIQLWALHKIKFCVVVTLFFKSTCHVRCFYFSSLNKADMLVLDCLGDTFICVEICKGVWSLAFPTWSTIHILEHMIFFLSIQIW